MKKDLLLQQLLFEDSEVRIAEKERSDRCSSLKCTKKIKGRNVVPEMKIYNINPAT